MDASHDEFTKYPRTPHLFGSTGTSDDKHLGEAQSLRFLADESLIIEEKIDGTNVGIHFASAGEMILQCRGHLITEKMHPQYDLFKQWAHAKRSTLEDRLGCNFILFGEWMYARHSIHYLQLPHYFFEFDIYDKTRHSFLTLSDRRNLLAGSGVETVPIIHTGPINRSQLESLIGPSAFGSCFQNPTTGRTDNRMEGLYLRTETRDAVSRRAKFVRPEFVEKIKQSTHWQHQAMVANRLSDGAEIWS